MLNQTRLQHRLLRNNPFIRENLFSDYVEFGDPRSCKRHPEVVISSLDGMFDGLCSKCESEMEDDE